MKSRKLSKITGSATLLCASILMFTSCGNGSPLPEPEPPVATPIETAKPSISPKPLTPTPTPTVSASPKETTSPTPTPSSKPTQPPSKTATPSPTPSKTMTDEKATELEQKSVKTHEPLTRYAITDLNVRSGPGTEYDIIDYLNKGDEIKVDATVKYWQRLEGTNYWVSSGYLNKSKPVDLSKAEEDKKRRALEKIASKYGCPTATVILDDPRLGSIANAKADWGANSILFRSTAPKTRWDYLMAHECSHLLQYDIYGGDIDELSSDMNKIYGGVHYEGLEQNSDCFVYAVNPKNTQWHYTQECGGKRGESARAIMQGKKPKVK